MPRISDSDLNLTHLDHTAAALTSPFVETPSFQTFWHNPVLAQQERDWVTMVADRDQLDKER